MAGTLMMLGKMQVFDNNGLPAAGYQLFCYEAGTTTKLATYSDANLTIPNTNPIVLDAAGRATVFASAAAYKQVLAPPTDTDPPTVPLWTVDGIAGTPQSVNNLDLEGTAGEALTAGQVAYMSDGQGGLTAGHWYLTDSDHNYSSTDAPTRGIVTAGGVAGTTVSIRVQGRYVLGGSLSQGAVYYIDAVAGALSTSSTQENKCPFGQADSTTSIVFPIELTVSVALRTGIVTYAYSGAGGGQGNDAGSGDTELTSYPIKIPANFLDQPGGLIRLEGVLARPGAAGATTTKMSISIGTTGVLDVFSYATAGAFRVIRFHLDLVRRTATTAIAQGEFHVGTGNLTAITTYQVNHELSGTCDWATDQDLKLYLSGTVANYIYLTELAVSHIRSPYGSII